MVRLHEMFVFICKEISHLKGSFFYEFAFNDFFYMIFLFYWKKVTHQSVWAIIEVIKNNYMF